MFKTKFKYYKSKVPPPDLSEVLDFNNSEHLKKYEVHELAVSPTYNDCSISNGLIPVNEWKIYEVGCKPGLILIKNPFTLMGERYWIVRSLNDYTKKPNKLNIDIHGTLLEGQNWWESGQEDKKILMDLRWATLGYHHNWDTKVYTEDNKSPFPQDLKWLCNYIGQHLNFDKFNAEAAIVNFYHMDSTLAGHTDRSEQNLNAPLFSISFGNSAIFLIGGTSLEDDSIPIYLHSGDILIMSHEARLCYHAVPKILKSYTSNNKSRNDNFDNFFNNEIILKCKDDLAFSSYIDYLKSTRININVRQVLQGDQRFLIKL